MSDNQDLVITRVFDAPRELVYRAFTDPHQLSRWFGPVGFSVPHDSVDVDLRVGGHQRFTMVNDDDPGMVNEVDAVFTEVIENELLVGTQKARIADLDRTVTFTLRLEFHDEDGKTRLVLRQGPYTQELAEMAREGWSSSFTKLDTLLAT